jgi:hypothetical protein
VEQSRKAEVMRPKLYNHRAIKLVGRIIPYKQGQHAHGLGKYLNRIGYLILFSDACQRKNKNMELKKYKN